MQIDHRSIKLLVFSLRGNIQVEIKSVKKRSGLWCKDNTFKTSTWHSVSHDIKQCVTNEIEREKINKYFWYCLLHTRCGVIVGCNDHLENILKRQIVTKDFTLSSETLQCQHLKLKWLKWRNSQTLSSHAVNYCIVPPDIYRRYRNWTLTWKELIWLQRSMGEGLEHYNLARYSPAFSRIVLL